MEKKWKSCSGCRALIKTSGDGDIIFTCYLRKPYSIIKVPVYDRRLDSYVDIKPNQDCKRRTNKTLFT